MSEEVKRYSYVDLPFSTASGHYVLHSDYAELEREVKELREAIQKSISALNDGLHTGAVIRILRTALKEPKR